MKELTANINGKNIYVYTDCVGDIFLEEVNYNYLEDSSSNQHSPKPLFAGTSKKGLDIYVGIKHNGVLDHTGVPGITVFLCDKDGNQLRCGVVASLAVKGLMLHPNVDQEITPYPLDEDGCTIIGKF